VVGQLTIPNAAEAYSHLDFLLYQKLRAWAKRRHPNKTGHWIASRYWLVNRLGLCFQGNKLLQLVRHSETQLCDI